MKSEREKLVKGCVHTNNISRTGVPLRSSNCGTSSHLFGLSISRHEGEADTTLLRLQFVDLYVFSTIFSFKVAAFPFCPSDEAVGNSFASREKKSVAKTH
jgi:hypothetical protein